MDAEVIIIGGGPVGLVMAGLLACRNMECLLVDAGAGATVHGPLAEDPRALALTPASGRILQAIDVWPKLPEERLGRFRRMHVWDENGTGEISFNCEELQWPVLGHIVAQPVLQHTLEQVLSCMPSVGFERGQAVTGLEFGTGEITVQLQEGSLSARLVIGADGSGSAVRNLAGLEARTDDYFQQALACVVRTGRNHDEVARQRFLTDGPLAFLPMAGPDQCGVVWSTSPRYAELLAMMDQDDFHHALARSFEYMLGEVHDSGRRHCFPLQGVEAVDYCRERVVLIGDAAHGIHPLAGQGANLGLLDAACLAEILAHARRKGKDPGRLNILRRYERWRRAENRIMKRVMEGFKYLFEDQTPPLPLLRNAGLDMVDAAGPLKHWLMRRAMGLAGDLPAVVRQ